MFDVKVVLDSLAPCGKRLTTITATYPRFIHSEIMTHRDRERNAASSRAIPWEHKPGAKATNKSMKEMILMEPVVPIRFGSELKGMQTGGEIATPELARAIWLKARDNAVESAQALADLGVHKSICNRLTEPFMWITVVMTATEWKNFFRLRCHPDAEIHFQKIAGMIRDALAASTPTPPPAIALATHNGERFGEQEESWHLPFVTGVDLYDLLVDYGLEDVKAISAARVARVSYLTHEGKRDPVKDLDLFQRLADGSGFGHWSPHGHVAKASGELVRSGPFIGWEQYRKQFPNENLEG